MIPELVAVAADILGSVAKLISAGADKAKQEEALMEAQEATKRGLDYIKFGATG